MAALQISATNLSLNEKQALTALVAETALLRASLVAITAKLDADAGVTDTTYGSLCNPAAAPVTA